MTSGTNLNPSQIRSVKQQQKWCCWKISSVDPWKFACIPTGYYCEESRQYSEERGWYGVEHGQYSKERGR
jgi:hypothetical protein